MSVLWGFHSQVNHLFVGLVHQIVDLLHQPSRKKGDKLRFMKQNKREQSFSYYHSCLSKIESF